MIRLTWGEQPAYDLITGYRILRAVNGGSQTPLTTTANDVFLFEDTDVSPGNTYTYGLVIVTNNGDYPQVDMPTLYVSFP